MKYRTWREVFLIRLISAILLMDLVLCLIGWIVGSLKILLAEFMAIIPQAVATMLILTCVVGIFALILNGFGIILFKTVADYLIGIFATVAMWITEPYFEKQKYKGGEK